jgi:hypothetical protein
MTTGLKSLIDNAYKDGRNVYTTIRKVSAIASVAGYWVDMSMAPGNPTANFYVGAELESTIPTNWYKKGIWHGGAVSPGKKFLHKLNLLGTTAVLAPAPFILCDYLMYYPLIDMDSTDTQTFVNSLTIPRYTDGVGVKAFLVATNPYVGGAKFQISYTNSNGVSGRISQLNTTNTSTFIGTLVNSNTAGVLNFGAFIELAAGDIGIRSIESITFYAPNGGLATLVLAFPITYTMTREATAWAEFDFIKDKPELPRIYDDAYLNLLVMPGGTIAAIPLLGEVTTISTN